MADKPQASWKNSKPDTITVKGSSSVVAANKAVRDVQAIKKGAGK